MGEPQRQPRPNFEVVTGGGLDARVRQGVTPQFVARVKAVLVIAAAVLALGAVRVGLTVATVSTLMSTSDLQSQVDEAQTLSQELGVERSVLSSNARISRIATQNYGMVLATEHASVDVSATDGDAAATASDASSDGSAATDATAADPSAPTDGEGANSSAQAGADSSMG